MPQTSWHTFDFALDARRESGAGLERPLNQVSQIAVIVPTPTSCHGMDRWGAKIMLPSGNESLLSVVAARHASAIAWSRTCRRLYRDVGWIGRSQARRIVDARKNQIVKEHRPYPTRYSSARPQLIHENRTYSYLIQRHSCHNCVFPGRFQSFSTSHGLLGLANRLAWRSTHSAKTRLKLDVGRFWLETGR
jgi:hypothetical protein